MHTQSKNHVPAAPHADCGEDPAGVSRPLRPADFYTSLLFLALAFGGLGAACVIAIFR